MTIPRLRGSVAEPNPLEAPDAGGQALEQGYAALFCLSENSLPLSCFVGTTDFEYESLCTAFERHLGLRVVNDGESQDVGYVEEPSDTLFEKLVHAHPLWDGAVDSYGSLIHTLLPTYEIHRGTAPSSGNIHLFRDMHEYRECEDGLRTFMALCARSNAKLHALSSVTEEFVHEYSEAIQELEKLEGDCGPSLKEGPVVTDSPATGRHLAERVQELSTLIKRKWGQKIERLQSECSSKKRRPNLTEEQVGILKSWFAAHQEHPYPSSEERVSLAEEAGMEISQVSNWFTNVRKRYWKDKTEAHDVS